MCFAFGHVCMCVCVEILACIIAQMASYARMNFKWAILGMFLKENLQISILSLSMDYLNIYALCQYLIYSVAIAKGRMCCMYLSCRITSA